MDEFLGHLLHPVSFSKILGGVVRSSVMTVREYTNAVFNHTYQSVACQWICSIAFISLSSVVGASLDR